MFVPSGVAGSVQLPIELEEGTGCSMLVEVDDVVRQLKIARFGPKGKIRVFFKDALGTTFKSRLWPVDLRSLGK